MSESPAIKNQPQLQPEPSGPPGAPGPQMNPMHIFNALNAHQLGAALKTAVELELFTRIGEGLTTVDQLARHLHASERGVRILCDYLVITGFLTKEAVHYGLTPEAAQFLDQRSPAYIGSIANFLVSPEITRAFESLTDSVRKGSTITAEDGSTGAGNPRWVEFARSMMPLMAFPAEMIAQQVGAMRGDKWKVLDIAAGHGLYGITIARRNPHAEVVAVDWPQVLEVAKENARKLGVDTRYSTIPGSAFDVDFGSEYDLVLITGFLHHFSLGQCEKLLRKVHKALKPGGRAAILDFVPNEDRVTPPYAAGFAMIMLATTSNGDAYTFPELDQVLRNAGFQRNELFHLSPTPQSLILSQK